MEWPFGVERAPDGNANDANRDNYGLASPTPEPPEFVFLVAGVGFLTVLYRWRVLGRGQPVLAEAGDCTAVPALTVSAVWCN
jgi:hypothetical protein